MDLKGCCQRGSEVAKQQGRGITEMALLELIKGVHARWSTQVPVQHPTARSCDRSGCAPEQIRLMEVVQKAVARHQISPQCNKAAEITAAELHIESKLLGASLSDGEHL